MPWIRHFSIYFPCALFLQFSTIFYFLHNSRFSSLIIFIKKCCSKKIIMLDLLWLQQNAISSGAMSSIFYPHAAKKCCAARGYKMLHVAHQVNTAANSIFAVKKCCKNTAAKSNQFDLAVFLQHFFAFWP